MQTQTTAEITTYTADISICSQICRLAVQEHGLHHARDVAVDIEHAMENYDPWFVRMQPAMTVPVLQHDDVFIRDSRDILYFLAEHYPGADLYPEAARADIDAFIDAFYGRFGAVGAFTFGHLQARSDSLREFINIGKTETTLRKLEALLDDPELGEAARNKLETVKKRDFSRLADPAVMERADAGIASLLVEVQDKLADGRTFLSGDTYTLADVVATALLARVHFIKDTSLFGAELETFWNDVQARPSFTSANVCSTWESTQMSRQYAEFLESSNSRA